MALASLDDVRHWLTFSDGKLSLDDVNVEGPEVEAQRLIKSLLSGTFTSAQLQSWADPDSTPPLIRNVVGELIAAYIYRDAYSEDDPDVTKYAQQLYDEALAKIAEIRAGTLVVLDENDVPLTETALEMSADDFWPNDSTEGPYFTMGQQFG
jgi:hypothetical protein